MGKRWIVVAAWLWPAVAWGQEELITDRPDQTESAVVVAPGTVQVETGWIWEKDEGTNQHGLPGTLLRLGWLSRLELRLGWEGGQWFRDSGGHSSAGVGDGELGAKFGLWAGPESTSQGAVLVGIGLPWGSSEFSSGSVDPSLRLAMAHELNDRMGLGWNLGWTRRGGGADGKRDSRLFYTLSWGLELASRWGAFLEVFGDTSTGGGGHTTSFDGGFTWLAAECWQLDTSAGVGLTSGAADWFVGMGMSFRWPH